MQERGALLQVLLLPASSKDQHSPGPTMQGQPWSLSPEKDHSKGSFSFPAK